ncbi:hypothetical protein, partial [Streptomyces triculaminicus]|uniref:hypothetical protein n=1 Tax=Streptomyces triculaminicus TaxID=2816232 RepID=UPI0037D604F1
PSNRLVAMAVNGAKRAPFLGRRRRATQQLLAARKPPGKGVSYGGTPYSPNEMRAEVACSSLGFHYPDSYVIQAP